MFDRIQKAGDIHISKITMSTSKGELDLSMLFSEANIFEDIYSPTLSGSLVIADTQNLLQSLPISGSETLSIEFITPSFPSEYRISQTFVVTKISDRVIAASEHHQVYNIYFVSPEASTDMGTKISKKFEGTADVVVKKILSEYLKSSKTLTADTPANSLSFVTPFWQPFKTISYFATQSIKSGTNVPNYLFFETARGYKFNSLETLYSKPPKAKFFHDKNPLRANGIRNIQAEYEQVLELRFNDHYNQQERIDAGVHYTKSYIHDITSKNLRSVVFSYDNSFKKTKHLGNYPLIPNQEASHRIVTHKETYSKVHDNFPHDYSGDVRNMRVPLLYDLEMLKLDLTVWGRTDLEVGDIVEFKMNTWGAKTSEDKHAPQDDKYYNGKYIITALHHRFNQFQHQMTMQIAKNAAEESIA